MYEVYFGSCSDAYHKKQIHSSSKASSLLTSISHASATSPFTRRGSIAGILSERRASHQSGRRYSDASFTLHKRMDEMNLKSRVILPSVHNKEVSTSQLKNLTDTDEIRLSDNAKTQDENHEEVSGVSVINHDHPDQAIKLRCIKDEEATTVDEGGENYELPNTKFVVDSEKKSQ